MEFILGFNEPALFLKQLNDQWIYLDFQPCKLWTRHFLLFLHTLKGSLPWPKTFEFYTERKSNRSWYFIQQESTKFGQKLMVIKKPFYVLLPMLLEGFNLWWEFKNPTNPKKRRSKTTTKEEKKIEEEEEEEDQTLLVT